jgi:hypothetical protein
MDDDREASGEWALIQTLIQTRRPVRATRERKFAVAVRSYGRSWLCICGEIESFRA